MAAAWVSDSRYTGYLGPSPSPTPLTGDSWVDFLQQMLAGVTGLDPTLVRPWYQNEPPNIPDYGTTWLSLNLNKVVADWDPEIRHHDGDTDNPDGYDEFSRVELVEVVLAFYGPDSELRFDHLRDGLYIEQNREILRTQEVGLVEITPCLQHGELIKNRFVARLDTTLVLRRTIRRHYPILNLLRAQGDVATDTDLDSSFDTANEES